MPVTEKGSKPRGKRIYLTKRYFHAFEHGNIIGPTALLIMIRKEYPLPTSIPGTKLVTIRTIFLVSMLAIVSLLNGFLYESVCDLGRF